jgi:5S rRNA maturation endonuclease (ribonuclease M5)
MARCPAHDDHHPSLSICLGEDGRILLYCHAGCSLEAICAAMHIEVRDLFPEPRIIATYDYTDENGTLLYQVLRYAPRDFKQRRPDGNGGWIWRLDDVRRVLYRLPELRTAQSVIVCEGEKDVDTARSLGFASTTNPHGASSKWTDEYSEYLRDKFVAVIADRDEPGRKHAQQVALCLHGKAKTLKMLEMPGAKDLTEWVERGGTRLVLMELIENTPDWTPEQSASRIVLVNVEQFLARKSEDESPYIVSGLLPARSQTIWQGRPKIGKSHTLLQIGFDAACGLPVFGNFPVPHALHVVYVELEEPEGISKDRFIKMLRGHAGEGPDKDRLHFFTKKDLAIYKMRPQELLGVRVRDFSSAIRDTGAEIVFLIAARKLIDGNLKDPEVAERLNEGLDLLSQETGAAVALAHHSRKDSAETLEAQGLGHTFLAAHADATFDISRASDGIRKVGREGRYDEDTFYLRKTAEGEGELIRVTDPPPDPQAANRAAFLKLVAEGQSIYSAAKTLNISYTTARRWINEAGRDS